MEVVLPRFGGNVRRVLAYGTLSLYLWRAKTSNRETKFGAL